MNSIARPCLLSILALAAPITLSSSVRAQVPGIINYQGRVTVNGTPFTGTGQFQFSLLNGTTSVWSNGVNAVSLSVEKGLFSVLLGDTTVPNMANSIPPAVFANSAVYLRVWFSDGTTGFQQLTPDQRIAAVGYALMAATVPAGAISATTLDPAIGVWNKSGGTVSYVNGNVGIGTISPSGILEVAGTIVSSGTGTAPSIRLKNTLATEWQISSLSDYGLMFQSGYGWMKIDGGGNVGIGVLPSEKLEVAGAIVSSGTGWMPSIRLRNTSAAEWRIASWGDQRLLFWNGVERMAIDGGGNVGIGKTSGMLGRLDVQTSGGDAIHAYSGLRGVYAYGADKGVVGEGINYNFYAAGRGIDYGSASSIRWKRDVEPISDPLGKVLRLRGVYFNWDREHGGRHDVGMVAEEVGAVLPEIIAYEENGVDASGMDYGRLTPLLVEAAKALKKEVDDLREQLAGKDVRITELKDQLAVVTSLQKANADLHDRMLKLEALVAELRAPETGPLQSSTRGAP